MTGTALTEAGEFLKIYKLDVLCIPTHRPLVRKDQDDKIYASQKEKFTAVVDDILETNLAGRPILVGTTSIEKSEKLSEVLQRRGIKHEVLNAKQHAREAGIIAQAGRRGSVTIATNMAGRGTDILLGGNPEFLAREQLAREGFDPKQVPEDDIKKVAAGIRSEITEPEKQFVISQGGLHILGTERHEARRIDNQLRGRAGRQGDPGSSRFYLALEDDLMRIFGSDRISGLMQKLGMEEGIPIEHGMVTRAIERAQKQVEAQNFSVRKHLLEYDDVMNKQRENVYALRREILEGKIRLDEDEVVGSRDYLMALAQEILDSLVETYAAREADFEQWDLDALRREVTRVFGVDAAPLDFSDRTSDEIRDALWEKVLGSYDEKEKLVGRDVLQRVERDIMLQIVDAQWKDHLYSLDHLKEGIGLRGYGQRDPLVEYKRESFDLFQAMKVRVDEEIVRYLWWLRPILNEDALPVRRQAPRRSPLILSDPSTEAALAFAGASRGASASASAGGGGAPQPARVGGDDAAVKTVRREEPKVGRNEPCPCGSGRKYKKCHGAAA
jgi:preprotein translocase subunit SecA